MVIGISSDLIAAFTVNEKLSNMPITVCTVYLLFLRFLLFVFSSSPLLPKF